MTRIFPDYVYGDGPRRNCWWDTTCDLPEHPTLQSDASCDVAIIGAGFTGLNAALALARAGKSVIVLESNYPGWGASGRNGGFCCLGGSKLEDVDLDQRFGKPVRLEWRQTEKAAVEHVARFLEETNTDADVHSEGETWVAHTRRRLSELDGAIEAVEENYGVTPILHSGDDLVQRGLSAGFHGGMTIPIGFALNPRKLVRALVDSCFNAGVRICAHTPVRDLTRHSGVWSIRCPVHSVKAEQVLIATNGYSSEHVPDWLRARYLPVQSSIVVSRPLTQNELQDQGWTSHQMCYDSRKLLHYFHLLPNNRMLFGMRGGLGGSLQSETRAKARVAKDFVKMFPRWAGVPLTHYWSGMVCLARNFIPFVGEVPDRKGLWVAMCYHGNGVAMGSYSGKLAGLAMMGGADERPTLLRQPLSTFPLGRARRALLAPAYLAFKMFDL